MKKIKYLIPLFLFTSLLFSQTIDVSFSTSWPTNSTYQVEVYINTQTGSASIGQLTIDYTRSSLLALNTRTVGPAWTVLPTTNLITRSATEERMAYTEAFGPARVTVTTTPILVATYVFDVNPIADPTVDFSQLTFVPGTLNFRDHPFSGPIWTVGNINNTSDPLPVELTSFTAQPQGRVINFEFKTAQEINSSHAFIEVSEQGKGEWKQVAKIQMKGNTSTEQTYSYTDRSLGTGKYDGRLKLVDLDGTFKYSSVVTFEAGVPSQFALAQNYPNPFNPTTTIEYDLPKDTRVKIEIYSITGELVKSLINQEEKAGYKTTLWNGTDNNGKIVSSGVYLYRIATPDFSMTKKMMFLK